MRREFRLPPDDEESLDANKLEWETILEGSKQWLIIRRWSIPPGYNHDVADVALLIDPSYPTTQIDMAYFFPELLLNNHKKLKRCEHKDTIENKSWQRWSRHRRDPKEDWREGVDNVVTHLMQVLNWLNREVE